RLAPLARARDRAAQLARRPQHELVLGILPALRPEGAADVAGDHADLVLRDLEDAGGQRVPDAVRVLDVGVERVPVVVRIVDPDGAPQLPELGENPTADLEAPDASRSQA